MPTDTLTICAILLCIVSAVCFYLYTRIKQVEKKVSLMEGILFDIKTAAESGFLGFPAPEADDDDEAETEGAQAEEEFIPTLTEELPPLKEEMEAPAEEIRRVEVVDAAPLTFDDTEESEILSETKSVQVNKIGGEDLESMSVADLAALARSKGISGTSKMRKPQLITAIKGIAEAAEVEGVNAESSLLSSSSLMASPI